MAGKTAAGSDALAITMHAMQLNPQFIVATVIKFVVNRTFDCDSRNVAISWVRNLEYNRNE